VSRPKVKLVGENGNIFNLIGLASKALKEAKQEDKAKEMSKKCFRAKDYDEALRIIMEYVDVE
jgi:hypothetical protein